MREAQDAQALCRELGRRIVQAAYLALAVHLHRDQQARQQQQAGGAGRDISTDGELPLSAEGEAA
ncbi:MAG TPA: hypothetical protein VGP94_04825 [Tepidisphaeraceae bacterium]|nr:hypothetical protein [Tepidisphaeraceae bacterium]